MQNDCGCNVLPSCGFDGGTNLIWIILIVLVIIIAFQHY